MTMQIRQWMLDAVTPALPKTWRLTPYLDMKDVPHDVTVQLYVRSLVPDPDTPRIFWGVTYDLVVSVPRGAPGVDDDSLDDALFEVVASLQSLEVDGAVPIRVNTIEREAIVDGQWVGVQQYRIELYTIQQIITKE